MIFLFSYREETFTMSAAFVIVIVPCKGYPFAVSFGSKIDEALTNFNKVFKTNLTMEEIEKQEKDRNKEEVEIMKQVCQEKGIDYNNYIEEGDEDEKEERFEFFYSFDLNSLSKETEAIIKDFCPYGFEIYCGYTETGNLLEVVNEATAYQ